MQLQGCSMIICNSVRMDNSGHRGHFLKLRKKRYRLDLKLFSQRQWFHFGIVLRTKLWQQHLGIVSRVIRQGFEIVRWWVSSWTDSKRPRQSMLTGLGLCVNITLKIKNWLVSFSNNWSNCQLISIISYCAPL